jgi:hypothetical protein
VLVLVGWIGITVTGSLHVLAILARIRRFTISMPDPPPARDRLTALAAGVAITTLALSKVAGLGALATPAVVLTLAVVASLSPRSILLAGRALAPRMAVGN